MMQKWPWVLGGVIAVGLVLFLVLRSPDAPPEEAVDSPRRMDSVDAVAVVESAAPPAPAPVDGVDKLDAAAPVGVGVLRGRVLQPDGLPAAGAEVRYMWRASEREAPLADSGDGLTAPGTGPVRTDDAGRFEVGALPRGELAVTATHETGQATDRIRLTADRLVYDFTLVLQGGVALGGEVVGRDGAGIAGARVMPMARDDRDIWGYESEGRAVVSDESGRFQLLGLEPGAWTLHAFAAGYGAVLTEPLPTGIDNARIVLSAGVALPCRVVDEADGAPVGGVTVTLAYRDVDVTPARGTTGEDGSVTFPSLGAGDYLLDLDDSRYALTGPPVATSVDPARKPDLITLAVATGGEIRGHLRDGATGAGIPEQVIRAWPEDRDESYYSSATDFDGAYALTGLPPGTYTLRPPTRVPGYPQDPLVKPKETVAVSVGQVSDGVDFTLTAGAALAGIVLDGAGQPVEGAVVRANAFEGRQNLAEYYTEGDGRFYFGDYSDGEAVELVAETPTARSGLVGPFVAGAAGSDSIELVLGLDCSGVIAGRVVDRRGAPFFCKIMALASEDALQFPVLWPKGETDGAGNFVLPEVCAGTYTIELVPRTNARQQAQTVAVGPGEAVLGLVLVYDQGELFELSGVVQDREGLAVPGARVNADFLDGQSISPGASVAADDGGAFIFEDLPEGVYRLSARAEGYSDSERATAAAGDTGVVVTMIRAPQVSGVVVGPDGKPVGAFSVTIVTPDGEQRGSNASRFADAGGRFTVSIPGQGHWVLRVEAEGFLPAEVELGRVGDEEALADIRVTLSRGA